ncbi:hypothetical protein Esti_005208 [Eimeria stiedai]
MQSLQRQRLAAAAASDPPREACGRSFSSINKQQQASPSPPPPRLPAAAAAAAAAAALGWSAAAAAAQGASSREDLFFLDGEAAPDVRLLAVSAPKQPVAFYTSEEFRLHATHPPPSSTASSTQGRSSNSSSCSASAAAATKAPRAAAAAAAARGDTDPVNGGLEAEAEEELLLQPISANFFLDPGARSNSTDQPAAAAAGAATPLASLDAHGHRLSGLKRRSHSDAAAGLFTSALKWAGEGEHPPPAAAATQEPAAAAAAAEACSLNDSSTYQGSLFLPDSEWPLQSTRLRASSRSDSDSASRDGSNQESSEAPAAAAAAVAGADDDENYDVGDSGQESERSSVTASPFAASDVAAAPQVRSLRQQQQRQKRRSQVSDGQEACGAPLELPEWEVGSPTSRGPTPQAVAATPRSSATRKLPLQKQRIQQQQGSEARAGSSPRCPQGEAEADASDASRTSSPIAAAAAAAAAVAVERPHMLQQQQQQQSHRRSFSSAAAAASRAASRRALLNSLRFTSPLSRSSNKNNNNSSSRAAAGDSPRASGDSASSTERRRDSSVWQALPLRNTLTPRHFRCSTPPAAGAAAGAGAAAAGREESEVEGRSRKSGSLWGSRVGSRGLTVREVIGLSFLRSSSNSSSSSSRSGGVRWVGGGRAGSQGRVLSWQAALCYSSKSYASLDPEALVFYLRMVALFEAHWIRIRPLLLPNTQNNKLTQQTASSSLGAITDELGRPASVGMYLVAPFLLHALRKVNLSRSQLLSLASSQMKALANSKTPAAANTRAAAAAPAAAATNQQQQASAALFEAAQQHVRLPNPLSLRLKDTSAATAATPRPYSLPTAAPAGAAAAAGAAGGAGAGAAAGAAAGEKPAEHGSRVLNVFLCCGGKDMLALDWLPFVSRYLHFALSWKVKRQQQAAAREGLCTFNEESVYVAALRRSASPAAAASTEQQAQAAALAQVLAQAAALQQQASSVSPTTPKQQQQQQQQPQQRQQQKQQQQQQQRRASVDIDDGCTIDSTMHFELAAARDRLKANRRAARAATTNAAEVAADNPSAAATAAKEAPAQRDAAARGTARAAGGNDSSSSAAAANGGKGLGGEADDDMCLLDFEVPVLVKMDVAFVLVDYPGYGHSQGDTPSPEGCVRAALRSLAASLRFLRAQNGKRCKLRLHVIGYSLGGAVALEAANVICKELLRLSRRRKRKLASSSNNKNSSSSSSSSAAAAAAAAGGRGTTSSSCSSVEAFAYFPIDAQEAWFPLTSRCSSSSSSSGSSRRASSSRGSSNPPGPFSIRSSSASQEDSDKEGSAESFHTASSNSSSSSSRSSSNGSGGHAGESLADADLQHLDTPLRPPAAAAVTAAHHETSSTLDDSSTNSNTSISSSCSSRKSEEEGGDSDGGSPVGARADAVVPGASSFKDSSSSNSSGLDEDLRAVFEEILMETPQDWLMQHEPHQQRHSQQQQPKEELVSFRALVLIAAFTTTADCAAAFLQLPTAVNSVFKSLIEYLQDENTKWNNEVAMQRFCRTLAIGGPFFRDTRVRIFHGTADTVVPYRMGQRLFSLAAQSGAFHFACKKQSPQHQQQLLQQPQKQQGKRDRLFSAFRIGRRSGAGPASSLDARFSRPSLPRLSRAAKAAAAAAEATAAAAGDAADWKHSECAVIEDGESEAESAQLEEDLLSALLSKGHTVSLPPKTRRPTTAATATAAAEAAGHSFSEAESLEERKRGARGGKRQLLSSPIEWEEGAGEPLAADLPLLPATVAVAAAVSESSDSEVCSSSKSSSRDFPAACASSAGALSSRGPTAFMGDASPARSEECSAFSEEELAVEQAAGPAAAASSSACRPPHDSHVLRQEEVESSIGDEGPLDAHQDAAAPPPPDGCASDCVLGPHVEFFELPGGDHRTVCSSAKFQRKIFQQMFADEMVALLRASLNLKPTGDYSYLSLFAALV